MPTLLGTATPPEEQKADEQAAGAMVIPFTRASDYHIESTNLDVQRLLNATNQDLGTADIVAVGYAACVVIYVSTAVAGSGGSAAGAEDAPFNALNTIQFKEPNGNTTFEINSGYELLCINKFGGYEFGQDPRQSYTFSAINATTGNFAFMLRLPLALNYREALAALPNQDAAATFKLKMSLSASTVIYATPPATTLPTIRVQAWLEAWDQPAPSQGGVANQTEPAGMNTTQYWSVSQHTVPAASFKAQFKRVGNPIRLWLLIHRRSGTSRANGDTDFPAQMTYWYDTRPRETIDKNVWLDRIYRRYGYFGTVDTAGARENGVYPFDFCHDFIGRVGHETRDEWLETIPSTRVEFEGTYAQAGVLTYLTNDVGVVGNIFL